MKKTPLVCADLGNRTTQLSDGNPNGDVKSWRSLVKFNRTYIRSFGTRPGSAQIEYPATQINSSRLEAENIPQVTLVGQGVAGMDGTIPVHKLDAAAGQGKIVAALPFVLGMLEFGTDSELEVDELLLLHPNPTDEVVEQFKRIFEGRHEFRRNGCDLKVLVNSVNVLPEGLPAYYYGVFQKYLNPEKTNAVVDLGGLTALLRMFKRDGMIEDGQVVMRQGGTAMLARYISKDEIVTSNLKGDTPEIDLIMDGLDRLGGFCYGGDGFSFADCVPFHQERWLQEVLGEYTHKLAKWLNVRERTILVGGSAYYAFPAAKAMKSVFLLPNFAEANVRGAGLARDLSWMAALDGNLISHEGHLAHWEEMAKRSNANRSAVTA